MSTDSLRIRMTPASAGQPGVMEDLRRMNNVIVWMVLRELPSINED
jgi:hypothetical protein